MKPECEDMLDALKIIAAKAEELDALFTGYVGRRFTRHTRDRFAHKLRGIIMPAQRAIKKYAD